MVAAGCLDVPPMGVPPDGALHDAHVDSVPDATPQLCLSGFAGGTFDGTEISGDDRLILGDANFGTYRSPILEVPSEMAWSRLSWASTAATMKPLPDGAGADDGYQDDLDMSGNVLLLHLDERSPGVFDDASPSGLDLGCGETCPQLGQTGLFGTSMRFGAASQRIERASATALEPASLTAMAWGQRLGAHNDGVAFSAGAIVGRGFSATGEPYASYGVEQVENHDKQPSGALRCYFGEPGNGGLQIVGTTTHLVGVFHVACVYDDATGIARLYVNGVEEATGSAAAAIDYVGDPFTSTDVTIGTWGDTNQRFNGNIDEVAIFDRALTVQEIQRIHRRGALRVRFQLRTCDDPDCDGELFVGPNGAPGTYYTENCWDGAGPPTDMSTVNLDCDQNQVEDDGGDTAIDPNRYAQFEIRLESDVEGESPRLVSASLCAE
jgi:hypothetical protein